MKLLKEIFDYREMIFMLVKRNLRARYKRSILGFAWTFINPLLQLLVYTFVFSVILKSNIQKYYLYLFIGLIPWLAISSSITEGSMCIISEQALVTKIYFPRQVLPIVSTLTNFVNMLLCFIIVLVVCFFDIGLNPIALLYLPVIIIIEFILALGLSFVVSSITVYFRDLQHILLILMMIWQFLTPLMYSIQDVPESLLSIFYLNPMTSITLAYHDILYYKQLPRLSTVCISLILGVVICITGWFLFKKLEKRFAEVL